MKPLDVVKVLMGIFSQRDAVKKFQKNNQLNGKLQEYDYDQLYQVCEIETKNFYIKELSYLNV